MTLDEASEIAVVLGAAGDDVSRSRASAAAALGRTRPGMAFIVTGAHAPGVSATGGSEAETLRDALLQAAIEHGRVFVEDESLDTLGNAVFTALRYLARLPARPLFVVTSAFHVPRALRIFRTVFGPGWPIEPVAAPDLTHDADRDSAERRYLRELDEFFAGVDSGDLDAIARRLSARVEYYANSPRLRSR